MSLNLWLAYLTAVFFISGTPQHVCSNTSLRAGWTWIGITPRGASLP